MDEYTRINLQWDDVMQMVDYLLQDSVCEMLVGFITQNGSGRQRPAPNDTLGEEMKLAYKYAYTLLFLDH